MALACGPFLPQPYRQADTASQTVYFISDLMGLEILLKKPESQLNIKQKLHHITLGHQIVLPFTAQPALISSL